jgi:hypothetical protein
MQFLADILHLLKDSARRKELLNAGTEEEVYRILTPDC